MSKFHRVLLTLILLILGIIVPGKLAEPLLANTGVFGDAEELIHFAQLALAGRRLLLARQASASPLRLPGASRPMVPVCREVSVSLPRPVI